MEIFCEHCATYFPAGTGCPTCCRRRTPLDTPAHPGGALWHAQVPGSVGKGLARVAHANRQILLVPWYHIPSQDDDRPACGGVDALDIANGESVWSRALEDPVEGSVTAGEGLIYVGSGQRGIVGAGQGWLTALDIATGSIQWRQSVGGNIRSTPGLHERCIYVTAGDGALHIFDAGTGQRVGTPFPIAPHPVQMPSSPVLVRSAWGPLTILAGTYSMDHGRDPGLLVALNNQGHELWRTPVDGNVRGTPVVEGQTVYVTAYGERPSRGVLMALDLRNGNLVWEDPFIAACPPGHRGSANFTAGPLVCDGMVYAGALDHNLYAIDARTGACMWSFEADKGIATTPALVEELLVFGANDGTLYAVERNTGMEVWRYALGGYALTSPCVDGDFIFAGGNDGSVVALPWHLGRYVWAAERLEKARRWRDAGDCRALEGHFEPVRENARIAYQSAEKDWAQAAAPELAGQMWLALGDHERAAAAFYSAGDYWRMHDANRAARYFIRAAYQYYLEREADALTACTYAASQCAQIPFIRVRPVNTSLVCWEESALTVEIVNVGHKPFSGSIHFIVRGQIPQPVNFSIHGECAVHQSWNIPINVTLYEEQATLELDVTYSFGEYTMLHGIFPLDLHAVKRPGPPISFGDIGMLKLEISSETKEGLKIQAGGDIGAVINRATTAGGFQTQADGDMGGVFNRNSQRMEPHDGTPTAGK